MILFLIIVCVLLSLWFNATEVSYGVGPQADINKRFADEGEPAGCGGLLWGIIFAGIAMLLVAAGGGA